MSSVVTLAPSGDPWGRGAKRSLKCLDFGVPCGLLSSSWTKFVNFGVHFGSIWGSFWLALEPFGGSRGGVAKSIENCLDFGVPKGSLLETVFATKSLILGSKKCIAFLMVF